MKHPLRLILIVITNILALTACYYDNEEALYPTLGTTCDTTNITFSQTISPMLASKCLSCHSNAMAASAGNNIKLEDYADVFARKTAIAGSIKHEGGYSPMPKNGGKLNNCSITMFDIWIKSGAPDN